MKYMGKKKKIVHLKFKKKYEKIFVFMKDF